MNLFVLVINFLCSQTMRSVIALASPLQMTESFSGEFPQVRYFENCAVLCSSCLDLYFGDLL